MEIMDAIPTAHHKQNVCDLQTTIIQVRHSWSAAAADLEGDRLAGRCDALGLAFPGHHHQNPGH